MERNKNNSDIQLDISNLIDNAVNNAVARRNLAEDSEDALLILSDEAMANITGGLTSAASISLVKGPFVAGGIFVREPITCGIIAQDPNSNAQAF
ncbi:hypothetical protein [Nostoc sp. ChiSLP03a]|uniref:hypothetical protein n=1 Tax=Nostoc sp. ChiSLP03a TaxID=3075380 RepID=UPI002AD30F8D|nr:hypothetical protein [Nostoc sp. ChiSLP03a]MDZ8214248.1 hypothetical protein [Nostoc sp. ChiSLP03a]